MMEEQVMDTEIPKTSYRDLKHKILLYSHALASLLHLAIFYALLIEWSKTNVPVITHFQVFCLVVIGVGLLIIAVLFTIIMRYEMRVESHARRFFHIWPLVHIGLSTVYQLVTQILVSHNKLYLTPSLYTAWATTASVGIHLVLHSISVFW